MTGGRAPARARLRRALGDGNELSEEERGRPRAARAGGAADRGAAVIDGDQAAPGR